MNNNNKKKGLLNIVKNFPFLVIPIIIVMSIIVLIVRYYEFDPHLSEYNWYPMSDKTGDVFTYFKSKWLSIVARVMLAILVGALVYSKKFYFHKAMIPLGVYAICIIISSIFSEYKYFVLHGIDNHNESVYILLTYCLLVVYSFWFTDSKKAVWTVLAGWMIGIFLMGVVGIFQLSGNDIVLTEFGKWLTIPKEMLEEGAGLTLKFPKGTVYLTLYNPNYVGFYAALTIPVLTVLFLFCKNKIVKVISFLLDIVMVACLFGSGARNGMVAVGIVLVLLCVMFRKNVKRYWKIFLGLGIIFAVIFIGYDRMNDDVLIKRFKLMFEVEKDEQGGLQKIETNDDNVVITYNGNCLTLTVSDLEDGSMIVNSVDENGDEVENETLAEYPQSYKITDNRFPFNVTVGKVGDSLGFAVDIDGKTWCFSENTEQEGYYFYNAYGKFTKIMEADTAIFENYSLLANGRGYLWARSIPLLKKYFFIGSGPDTFTLAFPQEDYVAASKIGYDKFLITKPHNLFLQIGVQTGTISMIAFIIFNMIYLVECIKLYWKRKLDDIFECVGVAIMLAVIGYLISGIINDSTITVAPIYWCLMGLGLSVNRIIKKCEETVDIIENDSCDEIELENIDIAVNEQEVTQISSEENTKKIKE